MKILPTILLLLTISLSSFGQQNKNSISLSKQDYLQKSKTQKKMGWIFLGGGAGLVLTAIIIPQGAATNVFDILNLTPDIIHKNDNIKALFETTGALCMLGSIPFFIASGKNKSRAMKLSFKNETVPQIQKSSFVYLPIPSVSLKFSL